MNNPFLKYYKTNFHIHLTGAFNLEDIDKKYIDKKDLDYDVFYDVRSWKDKKDFISVEDNLYKSICIVAKKESIQNVKYIEITINCLGLLNRGMKEKNIIEQLITSHNFCKKEYDIFVAYKIGINRKDKINDSLKVLDLFLKIPKEIKVCVDINGNERKRPDFDLECIFTIAEKKKIPISIHAGEYIGSHLCLKNALKHNVYRIAHAYSIIENSSNLYLLKSKNIIIEVCPISTINTNPVNSNTQKTQIKILLKNNINFVIGTDDPIFFKNSINDEFFFLLRICGVSEWNLLKIINFGLRKSRTKNKKILIIKNIVFYIFSKIKNIFNKTIYF